MNIENLKARIEELENETQTMREAEAHKNDYNGWKNYETWLVKLWLDNDEVTYNLLQAWLSEARENAILEDKNNHSDFLTIEDHTKRILADTIKEFTEDNSPLKDTANIYTDLLNSALSEVDYYEISENIMELNA